LGPEPELDLIPVEEQKPMDEAEARRARRAAILAKYQESGAVPALQSTEPHKLGSRLHPTISRVASETRESLSNTRSTNTLTESVPTESVATPPPTTPYISIPGSAAAGTPISGADFTLSKADDAAPVEQIDGVSKADQQAGGVEGVAAADYDPSKDRMDDEARRAARHLGEDVDMRDVVEEVEEEGEEEDDIDDIFALVDDDEPKPKKKKKVKVVKVRPLPPLDMAWFHMLL
jgi:hypothetical protein